MSDQDQGSFFARHPYITKYAILFLALILSRGCTYYLRVLSKDPQVTYTELQMDVTDNGSYLPSNAPFYIGKYDEGELGSHYVFVAKLTEPYEYLGRYWYGAQSYLYPNWWCFVASDAKLPEKDIGTYVRIDGLVCGDISIPTGKTSGHVATHRPALLLSELTHGDALEMSAPLQSRIEPGIQASSKEGVSMTLDALEYREGLTLAWVTLRNESNRRQAFGDLIAMRNGERITNRIGDMNGDASFRKQMASHFELSTNLNPFVTKGRDVTVLIPLASVNPSDPLEFCFSYYVGDDVDAAKDFGADYDAKSKHVLVTLAYDPKQGTV